MDDAFHQRVELALSDSLNQSQGNNQIIQKIIKKKNIMEIFIFEMFHDLLNFIEFCQIISIFSFLKYFYLLLA